MKHVTFQKKNTGKMIDCQNFEHHFGKLKISGKSAIAFIDELRKKEGQLMKAGWSNFLMFSSTYSEYWRQSDLYELLNAIFEI